MSTDLDQAALLRRELAQLRDDLPERIYLLVSHEDCVSLAAGVVPKVVQAQAMMGCEDLDSQLARGTAQHADTAKREQKKREQKRKSA